MVRRYYVWRVAGCLLPVALLLVASVVRAQGQGGEAASAPAVSDAFNAADNAWMLTASSLVLMMTAPALALFYCGLVRKKNVLSVMMQCIFLMCLMTVLWVVYGYSLVFGGDGPIAFFGTNYLFLHGAEPTWTSNGPALPLFPGTSIPALTHMLFQGMFFIITPALMCGAFAERMKFSALVVLMVLWNTLIYCPLAHMVWGNGVLAYGPHAAPWAMGGCLDFAGGTVIHVSSGVSALVCALLLGKRLGYGSEPMPPHNMTYTAIGAAMLWFGWFGFNAGSALTAGRLATCAFTATHLAAGAGGLAWVALEWRSRGKPSVLGVCSGLVAGLACVTQGAGYVTPMAALVFGAVGGSICYLACTLVKARFGYDDSLDVFGVHGVAGTLGAVLTGIFATRATGACGVDAQPIGLLEGGHLLSGQLVALAIAWGMALVGTFVLLKLVDALIGVRVSQMAEVQGLDISQHEEEGYILI